MERLTYRDHAERAVAYGCATHDLIDRLAKIEDILGDIYDLYHLRTLIEADRSKNSLVLPCNIGDTVYKPWKAGGKPVIAAFEVIKIFSDEPGKWNITCQKPGSRTTWHFQMSEFGKTLFISRPEAEAVLAALTNKED